MLLASLGSFHLSSPGYKSRSANANNDPLLVLLILKFIWDVLCPVSTLRCCLSTDNIKDKYTFDIPPESVETSLERGLPVEVLFCFVFLENQASIKVVLCQDNHGHCLLPGSVVCPASPGSAFCPLLSAYICSSYICSLISDPSITL